MLTELPRLPLDLSSLSIFREDNRSFSLCNLLYPHQFTSPTCAGYVNCQAVLDSEIIFPRSAYNTNDCPTSWAISRPFQLRPIEYDNACALRYWKWGGREMLLWVEQNRIAKGVVRIVCAWHWFSHDFCISWEPVSRLVRGKDIWLFIVQMASNSKWNWNRLIPTARVTVYCQEAIQASHAFTLCLSVCELRVVIISSSKNI
jgi:hypothetical protein